MASALMKRMKKTSKIEESVQLSKSKYYDPAFRTTIPTEIPMINVAHSGRPDVGMQAGILTIAGDSKHFKTGFMLEEVKGFQNKHPDGIVLFYDSEFGAPMNYFKTRNINMDNILHCPIVDVEQLRHDLVNQLDDLTVDDKVMVIVDSIGGLASRKEADDAKDKDDSPADFTRAKALNSMFRIVTPRLNLLNIPMVVINHTYETMEKYAKKVVSGGKKSYLASDDVWIIGRQQDKDGKEVAGYTFVINIDKSRKCKEKMKIEINSTFKDGINRWSSIYENASAIGYLQAAGPWIKCMDFETGEIKNRKKADIMKDDEWFERLLQDEKFLKHLSDKYLLIKED